MPWTTHDCYCGPGLLILLRSGTTHAVDHTCLLVRYVTAHAVSVLDHSFYRSCYCDHGPLMLMRSGTTIFNAVLDHSCYCDHDHSSRLRSWTTHAVAVLDYSC